MKMKLQMSLASATAALILTMATSQAVTVFAISGGGNSLVKFDTSTPGSVTVVGTFGGAVSQLKGIDFRPANGLLYGYDQITNTVVTINPTNAVTTFVVNPSTGSGITVLGMDFNPVADRLRLVNTDDQNLRINVDTGVTTVDTPLAYAAGDPNFGANPSIIDVAYTNSDTNPATGTTLYYIDFSLDTLVTTTIPNGGVLNTVGSLGFNTNSNTGFDIFTDSLGNNTAYALLTTAGGPSLYTINLSTGAATSLGAIGAAAVNPYSLAVVPEPGSTLLFGCTLIGASLIRRRKS